MRRNQSKNLFLLVIIGIFMMLSFPLTILAKSIIFTQFVIFLGMAIAVFGVMLMILSDR
jgi:hypothetical protein